MLTFHYEFKNKSAGDSNAGRVMPRDAQEFTALSVNIFFHCFSGEQFLSIANAVRPDTEKAMKIEVASWIEDYVTDMDDLFTKPMLEKLQKNTTGENKGYALKSYDEIFQDIRIEQEKKRMAEEERNRNEQRLAEEQKREEHNRLLHLNCLQKYLLCGNNKVDVMEIKETIVEQIVEAGKRFLIKGDPGMGKTTLMKKSAYDWAIGHFKLFSMVFCVFLKFVKSGQTIENAIIEQTPSLVRLGISKAKLTEAFKTFGSECLLILDGLDENASGQNSDVVKVIKGQKLYRCHVVITSRPHSTRQFEQYFNTIVSVEGFTQTEARTFAFKILPNKKRVEKVLNYNPPYFPRHIPLHTSPTLLSFMCLLVREEQIDLTNDIRNTGEVYVRMVRCLYKKYTIRKRIKYTKSGFVEVLKSVGRLALNTLLSGNPLLQKSEVIEEVGPDAFEYGLLIGHEDAYRFIQDETADIFVTLPDRSLEEFLGSFSFIQELNDGHSIESLLGPECNRPIFMTNPLFFHFCLWLLFNSSEYFTFTNKDHICQTLQRSISGKLSRSELSLPKMEEQYQAMNMKDVWQKSDQSIRNFFIGIFAQCVEVRTLVMGQECPLEGILTLMCPMLESVMYVAMGGEFGIHTLNKFQLTLSVNQFGTLESKPQTSYMKGIHFTSCTSDDVSTGIILKTVLDRTLQISTGTCKIDSFSGFLQLLNQECKLKRLCIDAIEVRTEDLIPKCIYLTHLTLKYQKLKNETMVALCSAVKSGSLPCLTHLSIVECDNISLPLLFASRWPILIHLDIRRCDLDVSDFEILYSALRPPKRRLLPKLSSLALSFNNVPKYTDALNNLLVSSELPLTNLFLETTNAEANVNFIEGMRWENMQKLTHLGMSLSWCLTIPICLDDIILDRVDGIKTLVLRNCVDNPETLLIDVSTKCDSLTLLDITHCRVLSENLKELLANSFPYLATLVLENCRLSSEDVNSLTQAKIGGRLPQLRHLDISHNMLTYGDLESLVNSCSWKDLLTLNITGIDFSRNASVVDLKK